MFLRLPVTRIEWFGRVFIACYLAVIAAVMGGAILAGAFDFKLMTLLMPASRGQPYPCNILVGARALFYGLWLVELATVVGAWRLSRNKEDIATFQKTSAKVVFPDRGPNRDHQYTGLKIRFLVLALIAYWGSYYFAYVDQGLCAPNWLFQTVLDGCYIIALNFCRGICLMMGYLIYFGRIASPDGAAHRG